jgi:hypothetical protein
MPNKSVELPLEVALAFTRDMRAFFKAESQLKQDEIASRQLHALQAFQHPRSRLQQIVTDKRGPALQACEVFEYMEVVMHRGDPSKVFDPETLSTRMCQSRSWPTSQRAG